jgi:hypothetical protein
MEELLRKIRGLRFKELTGTEIAIALIAVLVAFWAIGFVINIIQTVLPFVILALLAYVGLNVLRSRGKDTDEAIISVRAEQKAKERQERRAESVPRVVRAEPIAAEKLADPIAKPLESEELVVKVAPRINPDTGLAEADISRLEEREQELLKEAKQTNSDIQAQIEARKKRLMGGEGGSNA